MMRHWLVLTSGLLLAGCAATMGYDQYLDRWVGSDVQSLVRSWGSPTSVTDVIGGQAYTWDETKNAFQYIHRNPYGGDPGLTYWCKTTFFVDKVGTVRKWRWDGNSCRAPAVPAQ